MVQCGMTYTLPRPPSEIFGRSVPVAITVVYVVVLRTSPELVYTAVTVTVSIIVVEWNAPVLDNDSSVLLAEDTGRRGCVDNAVE